MKRKKLESSALRSAGYDAEHQILEAEFADGDVYRYENVPDSVWKRFFAAPSKGRFFAFHIRGHYDYHKAAPSKQASRRLNDDR